MDMNPYAVFFEGNGAVIFGMVSGGCVAAVLFSPFFPELKLASRPLWGPAALFWRLLGRERSSPPEPPLPADAEALLRRLESPKSRPQEKEAAVRGLEGCRGQDLAEDLMEIFNRPNPTRLRRMILRAFEACDPRRRSTGFLSEIMRDGALPEALRTDAAEVLWRMDPGSARAITEVLVRSGSEETAVRTRLIQLMGEHADAASAPTLLGCLRSRNGHVSLAAECALKGRATAPGERGRALHETIVRALALSVRRARFPWRFLPNLRLLIAIERDRLPGFPSQEAVAALREVLRLRPLDTSYAEQAAAMAAEALGEMEVVEAVSDLREAARSACDLVRYKAVVALGRIGGRGAVADLGYVATHDLLGRIRKAAVRSALMIQERTSSAGASLP
ncbi:MAG: HEAT repeat domain-containing protein [Elusimicrobiota bacterium]